MEHARERERDDRVRRVRARRRRRHRRRHALVPQQRRAAPRVGDEVEHVERAAPPRREGRARPHPAERVLQVVAQRLDRAQVGARQPVERRSLGGRRRGGGRCKLRRRRRADGRRRRGALFAECPPSGCRLTHGARRCGGRRAGFAASGDVKSWRPARAARPRSPPLDIPWSPGVLSALNQNSVSTHSRDWPRSAAPCTRSRIDRSAPASNPRRGRSRPPPALLDGGHRSTAAPLGGSEPGDREQSEVRSATCSCLRGGSAARRSR